MAVDNVVNMIVVKYRQMSASLAVNMVCVVGAASLAMSRRAHDRIEFAVLQTVVLNCFAIAVLKKPVDQVVNMIPMLNRMMSTVNPMLVRRV